MNAVDDVPGGDDRQLDARCHHSSHDRRLDHGRIDHQRIVVRWNRRRREQLADPQVEQIDDAAAHSRQRPVSSHKPMVGA